MNKKTRKYLRFKMKKGMIVIPPILLGEFVILWLIQMPVKKILSTLILTGLVLGGWILLYFLSSLLLFFMEKIFEKIDKE